MVRGQIGEAERWSAESAERAFNFKGWKGPEMAMVINGKKRWALHVGEVFRYMVRLVQREHVRVDRATV